MLGQHGFERIRQRIHPFQILRRTTVNRHHRHIVGVIFPVRWWRLRTLLSRFHGGGRAWRSHDLKLYGFKSTYQLTKISESRGKGRNNRERTLDVPRKKTQKRNKDVQCASVHYHASNFPSQSRPFVKGRAHCTLHIAQHDNVVLSTSLPCCFGSSISTSWKKSKRPDLIFLPTIIKFNNGSVEYLWGGSGLGKLQLWVAHTGAVWHGPASHFFFHEQRLFRRTFSAHLGCEWIFL